VDVMFGEIKNIRLKLLFAFLLPALGLVYFSAGQVYDKFSLYQNSRNLERIVGYVTHAASLTKELQKERGLSLGLLTKKDTSFFENALKQQRQETDRAYRNLHDISMIFSGISIHGRMRDLSKIFWKHTPGLPRIESG
jgi:hypothetical protein